MRLPRPDFVSVAASPPATPAVWCQFLSPPVPSSKTVLAGVSSYWGLSEYASLLVAGVLLTNLAYVGAAVVFFHLTRLVFGSERFAFRAALLLTVAPIGIFASAIYTERCEGRECGPTPPLFPSLSFSFPSSFLLLPFFFPFFFPF